VSVVHQEVSAQGPGRVVVHAACAVGHVTHHHRLRVREPAGRHNSEGHGWLPSPQTRVLPPSSVARRYWGPRTAIESPATRRRGRALATLRDVNMIKLESGNPPLQLGKAVCNSADYPLIKQYAASFLMLHRVRSGGRPGTAWCCHSCQPAPGTRATRMGRTAALASPAVTARLDGPPSPHARAPCEPVPGCITHGCQFGQAGRAPGAAGAQVALCEGKHRANPGAAPHPCSSIPALRPKPTQHPPASGRAHTGTGWQSQGSGVI